MDRKRKLEPAELWHALGKASASNSVIYLTMLPEDVATRDDREREELALGLEEKFLSSPALEFYSRVGMYDFMGVSSATMDRLVRWSIACTPARCGLSEAGKDGLAVAEILMVGTSEASRQNRRIFAYCLVGGQMIPAV
jgi:hypothetical protein